MLSRTLHQFWVNRLVDTSQMQVALGNGHLDSRHSESSIVFPIQITFCPDVTDYLLSDIILKDISYVTVSFPTDNGEGCVLNVAEPPIGVQSHLLGPLSHTTHPTWTRIVGGPRECKAVLVVEIRVRGTSYNPLSRKNERRIESAGYESTVSAHIFQPLLLRELYVVFQRVSHCIEPYT